MADQNCRRALRAPQRIGSSKEIGNIRGECGVGKLALARAEAGEIEAQNRNAERSESLRYAPGRANVLAAGEAMGKQCISARLLGRRIKQGGEPLARGIGEIETFRRHVGLPFL